MTDFVRLEGYALHAGVVTAVTLAKRTGPLALEQNGRQAPLCDLTVRRTDGGVTLGDADGLEVDLVEHLLAALGGLGIRKDVAMVVEGPELPILDGGARQFANALMKLDLQAGAPDLFVARAGDLTYDTSTYRFEVGEATELSVETSFTAQALGIEEARWDGTARAFLSDIAPARTFGFRSEQEAYFRRGRALLASRTGDPDAMRAFSASVVVFDDDGRRIVTGDASSHAGDSSVYAGDTSDRARDSSVYARDTSDRAGDAPARARDASAHAGGVSRHKLLDLIGDFAFYGGAPCGRVHATNPGHTASHRIIREALALGLLSRR